MYEVEVPSFFYLAALLFAVSLAKLNLGFKRISRAVAITSTFPLQEEGKSEEKPILPVKDTPWKMQTQLITANVDYRPLPRTQSFGYT